MKYKIYVDGCVPIEVEAKTQNEAENIINDLISGDLKENKMYELDQEKVLAISMLEDAQINNMVSEKI